jgi:hypothetical protein
VRRVNNQPPPHANAATSARLMQPLPEEEAEPEDHRDATAVPLHRSVQLKSFFFTTYTSDFIFKGNRYLNDFEKSASVQ